MMSPLAIGENVAALAEEPLASDAVPNKIPTPHSASTVRIRGILCRADADLVRVDETRLSALFECMPMGPPQHER